MRFHASIRGPGASLVLALGAAWILAAARPAVSRGAPAPPPAPAQTRLAAPVTATGKPIRAYIDGVPDTGQFLPDSTILARVNDHSITVQNYVSSYFSAYAPDRPGQDSLGRVSFLQTMVDKEVLGRTARGVGYTPTFEDRVVMREYSERVLSNILYFRSVSDSIEVTEADIQRVYDQFRYELHLRHILFADRATAERVRLDLLRGRTSWKNAVRAYSQAAKDGPEGDAGRILRVGLTYPQAEAFYGLKPGEISNVIEDDDGPQLFQVIERRKVNPMSMSMVRGTIVDQLRGFRAAQAESKLYDIITAQIGFVLDTVNVAWAAKFFPNPRTTSRTGGTIELQFEIGLPEFGPSDTSRVLARWSSGRITIGEFMHAYSEISPLLRPAVNSAEALGRHVANVVLEPYRAQVSRDRGYDQDPRAVTQIEMRREELLVEHLYEDSVASRVRVTPAERRRYYDEHKSGFITYASRRFATIIRSSVAGADSLVKQLKSGRSAEQILAADSLAGLKSGALHDLREDAHSPFRKVVYEELKPGEITTVGPGKDSSVVVIQLIEVAPGHQLSYEESASMADDNVRNLKSEAELQGLLGRLRNRFRIEQHPEWVMRVRMVDATL